MRRPLFKDFFSFLTRPERKTMAAGLSLPGTRMREA